jgi:hypothetical protein
MDRKELIARFLEAALSSGIVLPFRQDELYNLAVYYADRVIAEQK